MTVEEFIQALGQVGIQLSDQQIQQFQIYFEELVEWNQKVNLTAITEQNEVYLKHFYDCLLPLWELPFSTYDLKICDVGAGAGFPSIPLKIVHPEIQLTIIDSLNKRINFIDHLSKELGLYQVEVVHGRAEDLGQNPKYREQFDIVTARAVAQLNVLSEYCLPFLIKQGQFLVLKGNHQQTAEELEEAKKAIAVLGAKVDQVKNCQLPNNQGERTLILMTKCLDTPNKYPRKAGKPAKQPIQ